MQAYVSGFIDVLQDDYGVPDDQIFGIRYGLRGFLDRHAKPIQLSRAQVDGIQLKGGTVLVRNSLYLLFYSRLIWLKNVWPSYCDMCAQTCLRLLYLQGTSRGNAKMPDIVERLRLWGINMLFVIGGNGGNAAAHAIALECVKQGVVCNVVGVPKSIDNDIQLVSFIKILFLPCILGLLKILFT